MNPERLAKQPHTPERQSKPVITKRGTIMEARIRREPTDEQQRETDEHYERDESEIHRVHMESQQWVPGINAIRFIPRNKGIS